MVVYVTACTYGTTSYRPMSTRYDTLVLLMLLISFEGVVRRSKNVSVNERNKSVSCTLIKTKGKANKKQLGL